MTGGREKTRDEDSRRVTGDADGPRLGSDVQARGNCACSVEREELTGSLQGDVGHAPVRTEGNAVRS